MEQLLPLAEQLDRAAVELRLDHPIHNRLAIILIDNAMELMARHSLWVHTSFGVDFEGVTAKHLKQARSQNMRERLSVLAFVKELTSPEVDFVLAAHDHRNSTYHEGYADEPYLRQLAFLYYAFACRYLTRYARAFSGWSMDYEFTENGRRYYDASLVRKGPMPEIDRAKLASLLLAELPVPSPISLQEALADDLEADRAGIASGLRFLIEHTWPRKPTPFLLAKAQFDWLRDSTLEKQGLENTSFDTPRRIEAARYAKLHRDKFKPRYRAVPHGSWAQSIRRVRACPDPHLATVVFQRTRKNTRFLSDAIGHAAMRLEGELDRR